MFCLVAALIYSAQQLGLPLPDWINNYVNDFLCMPIVLVVCQYVLLYIKSDEDIGIPLALIMAITLYISIYFEYYLPSVNPRYTADFIDIILYFSGAAIFYLTENLVWKRHD